MKKGFFNGLFDFNRDGKLNSFERAMDFMAFEEMMKDNSSVHDDLEDDSEEELELLGLDYDELADMDEDERREVIEDAGVDPDDYDFY